MNRILPPALLLAWTLALGGCAGAEPPPGGQGPDRIAQRQRLIWVIGEEYRFIWDPEIVAVVNRIGLNLSEAVGVSGNAFHFYVIDRPTMNAFTTPLGDIFVFGGLLARMDNSSELAGVLAHEIGHVRANHFEEMQRRATLSSIPGFVAAILSRGDPRVITSTIAAAQSYQLHWSREMEVESDRLALQYLGRTGYDAEGLLGALGVLEKGERLMPAGTPEGLMTHPLITSRIAAMEAGLGKDPGKAYEPAPDPEWNRMRAVLAALTERPAAARRRYLEKAEEGGAAALTVAGLVLLRQEDFGEAEKLLRRSLSLDPRNYLTLADLGTALFRQGSIGEARDLFLRSVRERGGESYSYPRYYLGEIYKQQGESELSFQEFQSAAGAWPPLPEAHYQLALFLTERDKLGEADYHFGMASRLRGDFAAAQRSFSRAEARLGSDPVWASRISQELWRMQ